MSAKPASLFLFCALCLLGCGVETTLTRTGAKQPPRPENCTFDMLTAPPNGGYIELGTLDLTTGATTNLGEFRSGIRPQVCRAGGDAALALANGYGVYIKATVLKRVEEAPPANGAPRLPPPQPPAAAGGCSFDTQCKGDRVCAQGVCVDPPAKK